MQDKSIKKDFIHQLPAGILAGDFSTEIIGNRETKDVFFISNGTTKPFNEMDPEKHQKIKDLFLNDPVAVSDLSHLSPEDAIRQYSFCLFGAADSNPDFDINGNISCDDNFICSNNCQCLKWKSKNITVDGKALTKRKIEVVQLLATDLCDKQISATLNITESTLDTHKTQLYRLFGVYSKPGLIRKAINQKIVQ